MNSEIQIICCGNGLCGDYIPLDNVTKAQIGQGVFICLLHEKISEQLCLNK